MKVFKNRKDHEYVSFLKERMTLEYLEKTAIKLKKPRIVHGESYNKFIRIDLISITASTLLDGSNWLDEHNVFNELKNVLLNMEVLRKKGYFIKVRILMEYPYSEASLSRIQAESSFHRATILEPNFSRDFELLEQVDEELFNTSFTVNLQKSNLRNLQLLEKELRDEHKWNTRDNPSSITLKFAPFGIGTCIMFINDDILFDPYLFAKERRLENRLALKAPVISIMRKENLTAFEAFDDHFRYCWDLDITLDCEDATYYQQEKSKSLSQIRPPHLVKFESKSQRICNMKGMCGDEKTIRSWKRQVTNQFNKFVTDLSPTSANEVVFITCSWSKQADNISSPNEYAQLANNYLIEDFSEGDIPLFSVQIMQATPNDFLSKQLYNALDNSTIGVILLTKDIIGEDGQSYCRPNVYHELGYLMKQLGKQRIIVLRQDDVMLPSNINDVIRLDFESDRFSFRYHEVIEWMNNMINIPKGTLIKALNNHTSRLNKYLQKDKIKATEYNAVVSKISQLKHKIETGHNNGFDENAS